MFVILFKPQKINVVRLIFCFINSDVWKSFCVNILSVNAKGEMRYEK